jgi:hypothetical protein
MPRRCAASFRSGCAPRSGSALLGGQCNLHLSLGRACHLQKLEGQSPNQRRSPKLEALPARQSHRRTSGGTAEADLPRSVGCGSAAQRFSSPATTASCGKSVRSTLIPILCRRLLGGDRA